MATVTQKEQNLVIAIDPGFDSSKVVYTGGGMFKVPKEVVDITGKDKAFLGPKQEGFLKISLLKGKEHLVGSYATKYIHEAGGEESEERLAHADTFATFETADSEISLKAMLGLALVHMAEEGNTCLNLITQSDGSKTINMNGAKVYVVVTLPHDAEDKEWAYVDRYLSTQQTFSIETMNCVYNIDMKTAYNTHSSQVISALLGAISEDEGGINMLSEIMQSNRLPAIILDGGYKTLGRFKLTSVRSVDGGESNTTFAMRNIYERVVATLKSEYGRADMTVAGLKACLAGDGLVAYIKDGKGETVDARVILEKEIRTVCEELIAELEGKYNNLLDIKTILVTGGTGSVYYNCLSEILEKKYSWIKVILTDYEFYGEKISPEFAIAIGAFKATSHIIKVQRSK